MEISELYQLFLQHPSVQTDTRLLQPGDLFFALKGDRYNANAFAEQALDAGAAYAIVDEAPEQPNQRILVFSNVLHTLQQLAKFHRQQFNVPFLAITGSNGKTTTKELVHEVLSQQYITYTTKGNFNNHIGIPLTLLSVRKDAEMAVIEMGANHQKEIEGYCQYTLPTHGMITNCGKAHLEGFGGVEGVRMGKGELFDFLRTHSGTAFIMNDYDYLRSMSQGISEIVTYGTQKAQITGEAADSGEFLRINITDGTTELADIHTHLVGQYNLPNVLAALAIGKYFNVPEAKIKMALEGYLPSNSRSQMLAKGSNKIILDAYNANPTSMKAAIENLTAMPGEHKMLILGAMAELGEDSLNEHQQIIHTIALYTWNKVILVGGDFQRLEHPYLAFQNSEDAANWLLNQPIANNTILVKGSRSMQMEKVLIGLKEA